MAHDEKLATRIRAALSSQIQVSERRMFGGACFMLGGNMLVGVVADELMVRVGLEAYAAALADPHAREMDFTGRPMKGYVFVSKAGTKTDAMLKRWINACLAFVEALPPKAARKIVKK